ncbi:hypothetical protein [Cohnella soli]|uniref:Uncharacterized protein n=1 Tax=Cohnella soli TaxID=425005 RepID=A0ABW0HMD1_9BACL
MEILRCFDGQKEEVWKSVRDASKPRNVMEGGDERSHSLQYDFQWDFRFHFIHTGATADFLFATADPKTNLAAATILSGSVWDVSSIMSSAVSIVKSFFPSATFKQQRTILIYFGQRANEVLNTLNPPIEEGGGNDEDGEVVLVVRMRIDPNKALLDVEWVENMMGERG